MTIRKQSFDGMVAPNLVRFVFLVLLQPWDFLSTTRTITPTVANTDYIPSLGSTTCTSGDGQDGSCSNPDSSDISGPCEDQNSDCRLLALYGECLANPGWMFVNCAKSCHVCTPPPEDPSTCRDLSEKCVVWTDQQQECFNNYHYMHRSCRSSCWFCVDPNRLREKNLSEEDIEHRIAYSQTDFGVWQAPFGEGADEKDVLALAEHLRDLDRFTKTKEFWNEYGLGPGNLCNNFQSNCAQFATQGACHTDLDFMLARCSLSCKLCGHVDLYKACQRRPKEMLPSSERQSFGTVSSVKNHLLVKHGAQNVVQIDPENNDEGLNENDHWVLLLDQSKFWNITSDDSKALLEVLQSKKRRDGTKEDDNDASEFVLEWEPASSDRYTDSKNQPHHPDRSGKMAICNSTSCWSQNTVLTTLVHSLSKLLNINHSHFLPLEFVHYQYKQHFEPHHEFDFHDSWKDSGTRVFTIFVRLWQSEDLQGAAMGFPDLKWSAVAMSQGDVLIWPNVLADDPTKRSDLLSSEQLHIVNGEMYGVYVLVKQFPYDKDNLCS